MYNFLFKKFNAFKKSYLINEKLGYNFFMRMLSVNIPNNLRVEIGLTCIFGIGPTRAKYISQQLNIAPSLRIKDLTHEQVQAIEAFIQNTFQTGVDLNKTINFNRKLKIDMKCYAGIRLMKKLPLTGRTKSNSKTARKGLIFKGEYKAPVTVKSFKTKQKNTIKKGA